MCRVKVVGVTDHIEPLNEKVNFVDASALPLITVTM